MAVDPDLGSHACPSCSGLRLIRGGRRASAADLLLADVLGGQGFGLLVSNQRLAALSLEVPLELHDGLVQRVEGVILELAGGGDVGQHIGLALEVVDPLGLEALDVRGLHIVQVACEPAQMDTTCSSTGYGLYWPCFRSSV